MVGLGVERKMGKSFPPAKQPPIPFLPLDAASRTFKGCVVSHSDDRDGARKETRVSPGLKGH